MIIDALSDLIVPIEDLHPHPSNPRKGDVEQLKVSLQEFGQVRPILALEDGTIVAGHHVFYAVQELGWEEIAAVQADMDPDVAKRYLIADNHLAELGGYDQDALAGLLSEIMDAGQLIGTGYEPDDVEDLMAEIGAVAETEAEDFKGDYADGEGEERDGEKIQPMREVVLMVKQEDFDEFSEQLLAIKKAYEVETPTAAIREAIRREAQRVS